MWTRSFCIFTRRSWIGMVSMTRIKWIHIGLEAINSVSRLDGRGQKLLNVHKTEDIILIPATTG